MSSNKAYDVFLSHNTADKPAVAFLAQRIRDAGLNPFLDEWHIIPGDPWQEALELALEESRTCAVFIGPEGIGPWENEEMRAALDRRVRESGYRVIPVYLPGSKLPGRSRLPGFLSRLRWVDLREQLEDSNAINALICGIRGIAPEMLAVDADLSEERCPFRGLRYFDQEHARFFFGREADTQWAIEVLRTGRFLAIVGPSGVGKSSIVRAGLVASLMAGKVPGSECWEYLVMTPGARPLEELAAHLIRLAAPDRRVRDAAAALKLQDTLRRDPRALHTAVGLALVDRSSTERVLIVVDQLEEVFTLCESASERVSFLENILYASRVFGGHVSVALTLRADMYTKITAFPDLADAVAEEQILVSPMGGVELSQAIRAPAQVAGIEFDTGLAETILEEVVDEPGALPLMEHALLELWKRRSGNRLTFRAYQKIGRVKGAIARRAETTYMNLTPQEQLVARNVMLQLVQPGEGAQDARRRVWLTELLRDPEEHNTNMTVLYSLATARLLIIGRDTSSGEDIVDIAHEALISSWPRLRAWIDDDRTALRIHRRLSEKTQEWLNFDRDDGCLLRGAQLAETLAFVDEKDMRLSASEQDFLKASRDIKVRRQLEREEQEQKEAELERFTYSLSHDLKSPLLTIRGFLGLLERDVAGGNTEGVARDIIRIRRAAVAMARTMEELLHLSRIGRVRQEPESVRLAKLALEAAEQVGNDDVRIAIRSDLPVVTVDRSRVLELLCNLIDNAIKFMGTQVAPRIEVGWRQEDCEVILFVKDNGIGIAPHYHERIFELFEKLDETRDGTGVGLALVKKIVEVHGGRIWVESKGRDLGSTFLFTLPTQAETSRRNSH